VIGLDSLAWRSCERRQGSDLGQGQGQGMSSSEEEREDGRDLGFVEASDLEVGPRRERKEKKTKKKEETEDDENENENDSSEEMDEDYRLRLTRHRSGGDENDDDTEDTSTANFDDSVEELSVKVKTRRKSSWSSRRKSRRSKSRGSFRRRRSNSTSSSGGLDPAFIEDIRASLLEYSRIIKKRRGLGTGLYSTPTSTYDWGQEQSAHSVDWSSLFFDLIYVATAFQEGKLLSDTLRTERYVGFLYFYATFAVLYTCWSLKLHYSARFNSPDVAHKLFDILEGLIVAYAAGHLSVTVEAFEDLENGELLGFVASKFAHQIVHLLRWLELWSSSEKVIVMRHAGSFATELLLGAIPLAGAVVVATLRMDAIYVSILLVLSTTMEVVHEILRVRNLGVRRNVKTHSVPMHIEFAVQRASEFIMLVHGEAVLQIILVQFDAIPGRYVNFLLAYLLVAAVRVIYYGTQPLKAQGHALHQSIRRGTLWMQLQPIEASLIVCIGVGLKEILIRSETLNERSEIRYSFFFCVSLSGLLCLIWLGTLLHQGVRGEFMDVPRRIRNLKIAAYLWKVFLSLSLLALPPILLPSYLVTGYALVACVLQIITHDIWHRISSEASEQTTKFENMTFTEPGTSTTAHIHFSEHHKNGDDLEMDFHILTRDDLEKEKKPKHVKSFPAKMPHNTERGQNPAPSVRHTRHPAPVAMLYNQAKKLEDSFKHTFQHGQFKKDPKAVPDGVKAPRVPRKGGAVMPEHTEDEEDDGNAAMRRHIEQNPKLQEEILRLFTQYREQDITDTVEVFRTQNKAAKKKMKKKNEEK